MRKLLLFPVLLSFVHVVAQPTIQWQRSLGGIWKDQAYCIEQTSDSGYIVAGHSFSNDGDVTGNHGNDDYWIVKLTSTGVISWQKSLGGSGYDVAVSVQQTSDGGYIVGGYSLSNDGDVTGNHGGNDLWVIKLTSTGVISWQKSLGGSNAETSFYNSIRQTSDDGYVIIGESSSNDGDVTGNNGNKDVWVVKLTSTGAIAWQKSLGGNDHDQGRSIQQTLDGGYIVAGTSRSNDGDVSGNHGDYDYWIVKLTNTGAISWQKTLGGSGYEDVASIQQTLDGGYIVAGYSFSNDGDVTGNHGNNDYWIVKLTNTGAISWQKTLGGSGYESAYHIRQSTDGGFLVFGVSSSNDGDLTDNNGAGDSWVVKLTGTGSISWQKSLGGSLADGTYYGSETSDGGYIIAGQSQSNDGDVTGNHGSNDCWIVKLSFPNDIKENSELDKFIIYPNPTSGKLSIILEERNATSITIRNSLGQLMQSEKHLFTNQLELDLSTYPTGIYLLQLEVDGQVVTKKILKH